MTNPNYRYVNLARLIQIAYGPLPGMQAVRLLDRSAGTTYFNDLFHRREWPDYVRWFGLDDILADIATDYAAEIYDADDFSDWLATQKKIRTECEPAFTPTRDPALRTELSLDQLENSWLFGVNRTNLRRELAKNALASDPGYMRLGYATGMHLTYALFARRRANAEKLFAFCLAEALLGEIKLKLFDLPREGRFRSVPSPELLDLGEPAGTILDLLYPSIGWSFESEARHWFTEDAAARLDKLIAYSVAVRRRRWPSRETSEEILQMAFGTDRLSLLSLCAPPLYRATTDV